ncbi:NAD(P)H-binding protein [Pedobacter miscanthi]|uniref:NmrA family NAD(P)-binding protein n=1 Tax=Pedobacter miscanthi TaxID=2259170 RepID=UPI0029308B89|nr:NAD(P)H-binding protein [Pedobacter miscanthi]
MQKIKPTIVIFGCTGAVGSEVMRQLSECDCMVRGVLRAADRAYPVILGNRFSNVSYVSADLNSKAQLRAACAGADSLFLLTATSPNQVDYEINIIDAARESGVKRVVKLSSPIVNLPAKVEVSEWHRIIDVYLSQNIPDFCCLRPHSFMQNWSRNTFSIQYFGKIFGSLGNEVRNYIDCRDVATVAVNKLLAIGIPSETSVILAGPQAFTNGEIASKLSLITGKPIEYVDLKPEELFNHLIKKAKLPKWLATHIIELDELAVRVPEPQSDTITNMILRKPRIMDEYLQEYRHFFKRKSVWKLLFKTIY